MATKKKRVFDLSELPKLLSRDKLTEATWRDLLAMGPATIPVAVDLIQTQAPGYDHAISLLAMLKAIPQLITLFQSTDGDVQTVISHHIYRMAKHHIEDFIEQYKTVEDIEDRQLLLASLFHVEHPWITEELSRLVQQDFRAAGLIALKDDPKLIPLALELISQLSNLDISEAQQADRDICLAELGVFLNVHGVSLSPTQQFIIAHANGRVSDIDEYDDMGDADDWA